jgi:hypothetical protein
MTPPRLARSFHLFAIEGALKLSLVWRVICFGGGGGALFLERPV